MPEDRVLDVSIVPEQDPVELEDGFSDYFMGDEDLIAAIADGYAGNEDVVEKVEIVPPEK